MEVSLLSHVTNSALVVYALQYLKGTAWYQRFAAWLPIADRRVHVLMSAVGAFAASVGMHGSFIGAGNTVSGWQLTLSLAIPPLWVVLHAVWDWAQQMALNQLIFAIALQQHAAAPVVTAPITQKMPNVTVTTPLEGVHV